LLLLFLLLLFLIAIVEILFPRIVVIVLGRTQW
jgi:hypothetical protein